MLKAGGLVWGLSMGWAYVPPLANVIRWFPEKKGFASSAVVVGYGAGAFIAAPVFYQLLNTFKRAPVYLGKEGDLSLVNQEGRMFAEAAGSMQEVVVATAADMSAAGFTSIPEGVYVVGTGSTGGPETFAVMGLGYMAIIGSTAFMHRLPPPESTQQPALPASGDLRKPAVEENSAEVQDAPDRVAFNVNPAVAVQTPQFWAMYVVCGACACTMSLAQQLRCCVAGI